jgi:hypothetical protein
MLSAGMRLNEEHIDFVVKDLHRRGILLDDLEDEIIDLSAPRWRER